MTILQMVRKDYAECVAAKANIPSEFKRALKAHERVPLFIDNIARELLKAEIAGTRFTREDIKLTVYDMTELFLTAAMKHAEGKALDDLAKNIPKVDEETKDIAKQLGITTDEASNETNPSS